MHGHGICLSLNLPRRMKPCCPGARKSEHRKLRNEKGDLAEEFERATTDKRQLQDEKSRLLSEIASRYAAV